MSDWTYDPYARLGEVPTFTLESVTPFDMFPQTAEIEVLAHLTAA